jgi:hypothetical protein
MELQKSEVVRVLRERGDDDAVQRAERELPGTVDTDEHAGLLRTLGLEQADLAAVGSDTGLGSGQGSGLGINLQSEPEDPVDPLR